MPCNNRSGFTVTSDERQFVQTRESQTHKSRSAVFNCRSLITGAVKDAGLATECKILQLKAARVFRSDDVQRRIASQSNIESCNLKVRRNSYALNQSGIYERDNRTRL